MQLRQQSQFGLAAREYAVTSEVWHLFKAKSSLQCLSQLLLSHFKFDLFHTKEEQSS